MDHIILEISVKTVEHVKLIYKKVEVVIALLLSLCTLYGCNKILCYDASNIQSVSISCGHMDYCHSYSFYLRKYENIWMLDADYSIDTDEERIIFENYIVLEKDAQNIITIIKKQNVIVKLQNIKKPLFNIHIADETIYYTSIAFNDGNNISATMFTNDDLVRCFYNMAEKYAIKNKSRRY